MISLRRALPEEAAILSQIAFAAKSYWGYPERWLEQWKPQLTFNSKYFEENESWVAELNGISVAFYTLLEKDGNAWVEDLWVSPELIGKGIGKSLFLHALNISRQRGFKKLQLEADPNAVGFYEKMGMYKIGERQYELEGQLRILPKMEITL
jgi:ribosomal protein S18 acetylase RimI-like enzyme